MGDNNTALTVPQVETYTQKLPTYSRILSDNELSYFLPSRANGVNDIYLQMTFRAAPALVTYHRISLAWAIMRLRHPLLATQVQMNSGAYDNTQFIYSPPSSPSQAVREASANFNICADKPVEELIDDFLNGPRLLSSQQPSYLHVVDRSDDTASSRQYDAIIYLTHFMTDGLGMHQLGNLFFVLLGGPAKNGQPPRTDEQLEILLREEWSKWWGTARVVKDAIPSSAETRLPAPLNKFQAVALKLEFQSRQDRYIGGHAFPRVRTSKRGSVYSNMSFDIAKTKTILAKCKSERVTISNAIFVICNFAWIRTLRAAGMAQNPEVPMMMYTAVSLRPFFQKPLSHESFLFLSVSYFNIILPSFIPSTSSPASIFWNRARWVRRQGESYIRSPLLPLRVQNMSRERGARAKRFAKEDDDALLALRNPSNPAAPPNPTPAKLLPIPTPEQQRKPPSVALLGLSQMNNFDDIYVSAAYPAIDVSFVAGHTRKSPGGMLLFTHTFRGRLYLMFGWDAPAFPKGFVEGFWERVQSGVEEFMLVEQLIQCKL